MENVLFGKLLELEKTKFVKSSPISNNIINCLIPVAEKLLNRIPAYMPEYTMHDIKHCESVLDNISKILPSDIQLNIVELTILIYAVYLHDIGMVINKTEALKLKSSNEFRDLLLEFDKEISEDYILTELIRRTHVQRSVDYIELFKNDFAVYKIDFSFNGVDISDWVAKVILSHGYSIEMLENKDDFPTSKLIDDYKVNVQYLAVLLRLGDILDFDIFRTPYFLYKFINPQNNISDDEWKKHLSIEGKEITETTVQFDAKCTAAKNERIVRTFIKYIEEERLNVLNLLRSSDYEIKLTTPIKLNCRNDNSYIYNDLLIELNYEKVLSILMGTELYETPDIFIREVIQNAYDACKYRGNKSINTDVTYQPKVSIKYFSNTNILEIEDNGIGISEDVFKNYLIKIGRSYYQSKTIQLQKLNFSPISNFGIGILSCFMVSDTIEIESLEFNLPGQNTNPIHYILNIQDKYIEQRIAKRANYGTLIRLKLKEDYVKLMFDKNLLDIIKDNMNCFDIPISIFIDENETLLNQSSIIVPEEYLIIDDIEIIKTEVDDIIQGYFIIHANQHQQIIKPDKISQQCFKINGKGANLKLAPLWLQHVKFCVDIKPQKKLRLKANRNAIFEDQNYFYLKELISDKIIKEFSQKDLNRLFPYFSHGRGSILSGNQKEYDFLISCLPFQLISVKNKQAFILTFKAILSNLKSNKLAIIDVRLYIKHATSSLFWNGNNIQLYTKVVFLLDLRNLKPKIMNLHEADEKLQNHSRLIGTTYKGRIISEIIIMEKESDSLAIGEAARQLLRFGEHFPILQKSDYELYVLYDLQDWLFPQQLDFGTLDSLLRHIDSHR